MEIKSSGTFCPYCGKQTITYQQQFHPDTGNPIIAGSCSSCGRVWQTAESTQSTTVQQIIPQQPPKKKKKWPIVVGVIAVIVIIGAIGNSGKKTDTPATGGNADSAVSTTTNGTATPENAVTTTENKPEMSYEITDTSFNYYTNSIGRVEFYGIIEVTNTGSTNIYLKDCTFDLEDNDGHLLQSESMFVSSCPDIIAPGEKGYFYNGIGANYLDKDISVDNGLNLIPHYKIEEGRGEIVDYEVTDTAFRKEDYGNAKVTGRVTNNTDKDDGLLYVEVRFKDAAGKVLFITGSNVMDLTAGSTVSFEVSAMYADDSIDYDSIANYEVIARKSHYQF